MKKLVFLLMLTPFFAYSKFIEGSIIMTDNSVKKGLLEIPEYYEQKIKFKTDKDSKVEKITIDEVKSFEVVYSKNEVITFEAIILATPNIFNSEKLNIDKKKTWTRVIKKSKISLYAISEGWSSGAGVAPGATSSTPYVKFYIKKPNTEYAIYFNMILGSSGLSFAINNFNEIKKTSQIIFGNDCPKILEKITKEEFKNQGVIRIVDLYDENCGD